jgi:anion-transporting  ArsA/GET3 family ATPase
VGAFERRVQVVGGKGGVGRTTVSCGLAWAYAEAGLRTLLLEVDGPDAAAQRLGVAEAPDEPREVYNNLWYCNMTPAGSLREYALLVLRFRTLYKLVFENRLVKAMLQSIPSLGAFTMAGKFWYHTDERIDGRPRFDRIVVDLPATGHALTFLAVSRTVADLSPSGRMKNEAERMARMIEDEQTCLHIVTRAEEMPVNEALEMEAAAPVRARIQLGAAFMNRLPQPVFDEDDRRALDRLAERPLPADLETVLDAARVRNHRVDQAMQEVERYQASTRLPVFVIPDLGTLTPGRPGLERLYDHLPTELGAPRASVGRP